MSWTREPIFVALLAKLKTIDAAIVKEVSRRQVPLAQTAPSNMPAIYMRQPSVRSIQMPNLPPRSIALCDLLVYADCGDAQSTIKSTIMNGILDAIDSALAPSALEDKQTLGGLVSHCWPEGEQPVDENILGRYCLCMVPVVIEVGHDNLSSAGSLVFDVGGLFVTPATATADVTAGLDLTPRRLARVRSAHVDADAELVMEQVASKAYAIFAMSKLKRLKIKAEFASFDGTLVDQVFFAAARSTGATLTDVDRAYTIPSSHSVTVVPPASGSCVDDLGVAFATTGTGLKLVTGSPTAGQYSRSGAVYAFAAADEGLDIAISYTYALSTGTTLTLSNPTRGKAPTFSCVLQGIYNGRQVSLTLHRCSTSKLAIPMPVESFGIQGFEFEAFPNDSGEIGLWSEGDMAPVTGYSADTTPPTATVSPVNGATDVPLDAVTLQATVAWTFSKALASASITGEIKAWRYNAGTFTSLTASATLANSGAATTITALVTADHGWTVYVLAGGGITDQHGNHFAGLMSIFTAVV